MWLINTRRRKSKINPSTSLRARNKKSKIRQNARVLKLEWDNADEIKQDIEHLLNNLDFTHIDPSRIFCFRTRGSKARSYARIWAMPKIFQRALSIKPAYVIEVLSGYYDKLDSDSKKKVLIHELLHIPKNFSGALLPHRNRHRHLQSEVNKLFKAYKLKLTSE